ncbi:MAG: nucleotidyltransferase domain-containing protein [Chloroflexota bacterium]|nr:nucleotidyltransferase domain-containing protein [Chloroflexota bacterium]
MATEWVRKLMEHRQERKRLLDEELKRLVAELKAMGAQYILLFGSMAQGKDGLESDIDLMVVLESDLPFVKRLGWLYGELRPRTALDLLAYTPEELAAIRHRPFIRQILRDGKVLYEA